MKLRNKLGLLALLIVFGCVNANPLGSNWEDECIFEVGDTITGEDLIRCPAGYIFKRTIQRPDTTTGG